MKRDMGICDYHTMGICDYHTIRRISEPYQLETPVATNLNLCAPTRARCMPCAQGMWMYNEPIKDRSRFGKAVQALAEVGGGAIKRDMNQTGSSGVR